MIGTVEILDSIIGTVEISPKSEVGYYKLKHDKLQPGEKGLNSSAQRETKLIGQKKWSKLVEIIGRNYGVPLEGISGIKAGAFRSKINEHGTDIIIILKRYIGAQMKTT